MAIQLNLSGRVRPISHHSGENRAEVGPAHFFFGSGQRPRTLELVVSAALFVTCLPAEVSAVYVFLLGSWSSAGP